MKSEKKLKSKLIPEYTRLNSSPLNYEFVKDQNPAVTVVTAVYNSSRFLEDTINSVIAQSLTNWEMILVDDFSEDNSVEIIEGFAVTDERIKLIKLDVNSGAAIARNKAIELAQGRFIAFLDSDDVWLPNKLDTQINFMLDNHAPFVYSDYWRINEENEVIGVVKSKPKVAYEELLKTCVIGCLTAVYDTRYFGKVYMPLIRKRQDFGLWLKLLKSVDYAYCIGEPLALYRVRKDSISANKLKAARYNWVLYRDHMRLPLVKAAYYFAHYMVRGIFRSYFNRAQNR